MLSLVKSLKTKLKAYFWSSIKPFGQPVFSANYNGKNNVKLTKILANHSTFVSFILLFLVFILFQKNVWFNNQGILTITYLQEVQ